MRCIIPGRHVRVLGKAIHSIAKIGEDLYIDPLSDGLAFRSMNSARSAFITYKFHPNFFEVYEEKTSEDLEVILQYEDPPSNSSQSSQNPSKCRLAMRSILMVFRSLNVLEKTVESCIIHVLPGESKVRITLLCKFSVTKLYTLPFIEADTLQAEYNASDVANSFTCRARVLNDAALNFLKNQEEVTMIVTPQQFVMKNFFEPDEDNRGTVHTELTMQPGEFESFSVGLSSTVTFCLKELRAMIQFADAYTLPLTANYGNGGNPIVFTLKNANLLEAGLVMATLASDPAGDGANTSQFTENNFSQNSTVSSFRDTEDLRSSSNRNRKSINKPMTSTLTLEDAPMPSFSTPLMDEETLEETQPLILSPPSKKARYLFKKCFEVTFNPQHAPGYENVLAPDSDEEQ